MKRLANNHAAVSTNKSSFRTLLKILWKHPKLVVRALLNPGESKALSQHIPAIQWLRFYEGRWRGARTRASSTEFGNSVVVAL